MSATTQLQTFADLFTDLQNRVRVTTGVSATEQQAKRYINIALHDMHLGYGEKFSWAERQSTIRTQPRYSTGTVTISQGSTTLTGNGTLWNTNNAFSVKNARAGGKIVVAGGENVYEVSSVVSNTAIVLNTAFVSASVNGETYVYFEDEYDLAPDFLKPIDLQSFSDAMDIPLISRQEFRRRFPRLNTVGQPMIATLVDRAPSGSVAVRRRVRFYPAPTDAQLIPYSYVTSNLAVSTAGVEAANLSANTDEPIVPLRYRHAILLHALANWYRDKKDDMRGDAVWGQYVDLVTRIVQDNDVGTNRPRLVPRIGHYARQARRPWGGGGRGRWTTGSRFDELR